MEPLYVNSFVYDKQNTLEITCALRRLVVLNIVLLCFIALLLVPTIWLEMHEMVAMLVIAILLDLYILIFVPRISTKRMLKRNQVLFGADLTVENVFYDDHVEVTGVQSGAKNVIRYEQCKRVSRKGNFLIIWADANLCVPVWDRGFTKGSPAGLQDFIEGKLAENKKK